MVKYDDTWNIGRVEKLPKLSSMSIVFAVGRYTVSIHTFNADV